MLIVHCKFLSTPLDIIFPVWGGRRALDLRCPSLSRTGVIVPRLGQLEPVKTKGEVDFLAGHVKASFRTVAQVRDENHGLVPDGSDGSFSSWNFQTALIPSLQVAD